jgi:hypothetical protein
VTRRKKATRPNQKIAERALRQRQTVVKHARVLSLYLQGFTYDEIAADDQVRMRRDSVKVLIRDLVEQKRAQIAVDVEAVRAEQIVRLDMVERQAWAAWEASKADARDREQVVSSYGDGNTSTVVKRRRSDRLADPRYLKVIVDAINARSELLGLKLERVDITSAGQGIGASVAGGMLSIFQQMAQVEKANQRGVTIDPQTPILDAGAPEAGPDETDAGDSGSPESTDT